MIELIRALFSYNFIIRAAVVGVFVSLCAALLGVSLVLKRFSMIGDGLSHVGFGALAVAMAMNLAPLQVAVPVVMLAAFLLLRISQNSSIKGDAAIAIIASSSVSIGIVAVALTTGLNVDIHNFMFGSILAMSKNDLYLSVFVAVCVIILYIIFYNKIFAVTFDEDFAKATGTNVGAYNMLISMLTALTIVVGMRMMGAVLISSLIIFPALTSMRVFRSFRAVILSSAIVSVICFFIGLCISFIYSLPTGASIVLVNLFFFICFYLIGKLKKL